MKRLLIAILTIGCALSGIAVGPIQDTVIIELNSTSKIVIYTKTKEDLAALQQYDFNKMIRELNLQLSDSVTYLEMNGGETAYINDEEVNLGDYESDDHDELSIKLGGTEFTIEDFDDLEDTDWDNRKKTTYEADRIDRTSNDFNVDIGINNWLDNGTFPDANNAPYSVKPFGSWYVGLNSTNRTWITGPVFLDWGFGVSWYNWKLEDPDYRITEGPERTEVNQIPDISGLKSKLTASYVNVRLVPMLDFSRGRRKVTDVESGSVRIKRYSRKGIRIGGGVYAGYRIGSHSKHVYETEGSKETEKEKDNFFLENFRYGIRGQLGWKGVDFFVNYDLNEVFVNGRGFEGSTGLNAITFGVTL